MVCVGDDVPRTLPHADKAVNNSTVAKGNTLQTCLREILTIELCVSHAMSPKVAAFVNSHISWGALFSDKSSPLLQP